MQLTLSKCSYNLNTEIDKKYFIKLIASQLDEIYNHDFKDKQANEFCDVISICVEFLINNGYNPEEIMYARIQNVDKRKGNIIEKYRELI